MRPNTPGMTANPLIYELDTWTWLERLGHAGGRPVRLAGVPDEAWDSLAGLGVDARLADGRVETRPGPGTAIALADAGRMAEFRQVELDPWGSHLFSIQPAAGEPHRREEP